MSSTSRCDNSGWIGGAGSMDGAASADMQRTIAASGRARKPPIENFRLRPIYLLAYRVSSEQRQVLSGAQDGRCGWPRSTPQIAHLCVPSRPRVYVCITFWRRAR
jgi:hypothetical protein